MEKTKWSKKKIAASVGAAILVALLLAAGVLWLVDYSWSRADQIASHVYFDDIDLGGMTVAEAEKAISKAIEERNAAPIRLYTEKNEWFYTAEELGLVNNSHQIATAAYEVAREGNVVYRYRQRLQLLLNNRQLSVGFELNEETLAQVISTIGEEEGTTAEDAYFYFDDGGNLTISPSVNGSAVDAEKTMADIREALATMEATEIFVTVEVYAEPEQTTEDLEALQIDTVIASFSTKYNAGQVNRSHNLWQASQNLDMTLIMPGETFSFNETVGKRSTERGFRNATIIENGEFTDGMGGGVCQVSTTLYGAALRTELAVLERRPHSIKIAYVDPGQDAMVAWGSSDLVFRNDYDSPVLLHAVCGGGTITMQFYGNSALKKEVKIVSEVTRYIPFTTETVVDESLQPGTTKVKSSGGRGLECYVYKYIYENGEEVSATTVSHNTYRPQKRVVLTGPSQ